MQGFSGFPPGKVAQTRIPNLFFSELLPQIDHLAELKVTLYCLWALQRQEEQYPYVRWSEVVADELFMAGLTSKVTQREAILRDAFERAVARGTLLQVTVEEEAIYFMNSPRGRAAVAAIEAGDWLPGGLKRPVGLIVERPNIFVLYEQNIGPLSPMIVDQLRAAEEEYPSEWIVEAIEAAVARNVRNWRYIQAIIENRGKGQGRRGSTQGQSGKSEKDVEDYSDIFGI